MVVQFSKYHGTGNDFILIDSRKNVIPETNPALISALCDRHFGIGADGLILLMPSDETDFTMVYFNADGYEGSMCGNGGRCVAAFAKASGWIKDQCRFEASDGMHEASIGRDGIVTLSLNDVKGISEMEQGIFLDTGSPHLVRFVDHVDNIDVVSEGRKFRYDPVFPGGTNVNFVERKEDGIAVRTYERGVENETLSCGTGVTAAAIAASYEFDQINIPISVETIGGTLSVSFSSNNKSTGYQQILLSGPATEVFQGTVQI